MKILIAASNMMHINNFHTPYINGLRSKGHDVYVMAHGEGADFNTDFKKCSFSLKNLFLSLKIRRILKREKFNVVYLNTTLAAFWIRFAMIGMRKRPYVINTVHGYLFNETGSVLKKTVYLKCEKMLKNYTDDIVVMNSEDLAIATANRLCLGGVYEIRGMGVQFSDKKMERIPKAERAINLVFIGELSKRKNQIFLVKAMKKLPDMTLTLVGDGCERKKLEKYINENSLENRVVITGFTNNVYQYLSKADIYVCASAIEGLPFNILEAMHAKLPIVASDIKGNRDLLDRRNMYPYNDEEEYIKLIKTITIGEIEYNIEKYSLDSVYFENMEIYERPLEKKTSVKAMDI